MTRGVHIQDAGCASQSSTRSLTLPASTTWRDQNKLVEKVIILDLNLPGQGPTALAITVGHLLLPVHLPRHILTFYAILQPSFVRSYIFECCTK